jgi:Kef-type K+ transport system membrane component KefB
MSRVLSALDDTASQLRVRGAFVILLIFAGLAHGFGVDSLLGAFVAGVVLRLADRDDRPSIEVFHAKLDAIGFGFLIPVFFVVTGVQFNVDALFSHSSALELVPLLVVAIGVVRGGSALLYRRRLGSRRAAVSVGFLQSATLTFPVVVAEIGLSLNLLTQATAAALIGAALLSVLIFPAIALALSLDPPIDFSQHELVDRRSRSGDHGLCLGVRGVVDQWVVQSRVVSTRRSSAAGPSVGSMLR